MKHISRRILSLLLAVCMLVGYTEPFSVGAATQAADTRSAFDPAAGGIDFDRHTETDNITYTDDTYRFTRNLEAVPHTYQAWVKIPASTTGAVGNIIGNRRANGTGFFLQFGIEDNNAPSLIWRDPDKTDHNITFTSTDPVIPYDTWTHITIAHDDAAGEVRLYINGALYATNTADYAPIQQPCARDYTMFLGSDSQHWDTRSFWGTLGDVALWQDVLSPQEILDSYEKGVDTAEDSLIAFYDISAADKYNNIADSSKNGYDLQYSKMWLTEEEMNEIRKANGMLDENGNDTYDYSFAVVGDTQYITRFYPKNLPILYQWIVDNCEAKKMQYVLGMGDITDQDNDAQWAAAKEAISLMDGKIGYSLIRGNHDVKNGGDQFETYFGSDRLYTAQFEQYGDTFPEGSVANSYRTLRVGSTDWLFINLDWCTSDAAIDWAADAVERHPDHKVIISTHAYLGGGGALVTSSSTGVSSATRNSGDQVWTKLASQYENVELVLCGHVSQDDVVMTQSKGVHGNTVTQLLIDPQRVDYWWDGSITYLKGGAGIVTMLYFSKDGSRIWLENYSTIRGMYYQTYNQMTIDPDAPAEEITMAWTGTKTVWAPDGTGTQDDPYLISNGAHLVWLSQKVMNASGTEGWNGHCLQVNDIDLRGCALPSIGYCDQDAADSSRAFSGVYDGNGYTIQNCSVTSCAEADTNAASCGLFGMISGATIRNVTLDNITASSACGNVGILVGVAEPALSGTTDNLIENCVITATCKAESKTDGIAQDGENADFMPCVGGIAGALAGTTVRGCVNEATVCVPGNHAQAGGIAGALFGDCVIDSCINRGDIILDFNDEYTYERLDTVAHIQGGIVGSISGTSTIEEDQQGNILISNCENHGNFLVKGIAPKGKAIVWGGIVGNTEELRPNTQVVLHKVINTGVAVVENTQTIPAWLAGIVGYASHSVSATTETNSALVLSVHSNETELPAYNRVTVNEGALQAIDETHCFADAWTAGETDTHDALCTCGCDARITLPHRWDSGTVTEAATHTVAGTMTYHCVDCGAAKTAQIPKHTVHRFGSWVSDGAETHTATCACGITRTYAHTLNEQVCVYCAGAAEGLTTYWDGITATKPEGAGTQDDPYRISSAAHLYWLSREIADADGSVAWKGYCLQVNDIDLGGYNLTSIGEYYQGSNNSYRVFSGVYDGGGYTIKNGNIISSSESATTSKTNFYASGLFGMISGATIRNVTLDHITSYSLRGVVGALVGAANPALTGTADNSPEYNLIENCIIASTCKVISLVNGHQTYMSKGGDNSDFTPRAGGIAGALAYTTVRNCVNGATVCVPGNHANAGGIAGALFDDCVIDSCVNRGDVILEFKTAPAYNRYDTMSYIQGGIVGLISGAGKVVTTSTNNATDGSANYYKQGNIQISNCENHGNFLVKGAAPKGKAIVWGGIVGQSEKLRAGKNVTLRDAVNTGTATVESSQSIPTYLAGIVGYATHDATATVYSNSPLGLFGYENGAELPAYNQVSVNEGALAPITTSESNEEQPNANYGVQYIPDETLAAEVSEKQTRATNVRNAYPGLKAALLTGKTTYKCPMCDEDATWIKLTKATGNKTDGAHYHYYIDSSFTSHTGVNLAQVSSGTTQMCIVLLDANLTTSGRIHVGGKSVWNFMGEGTITTNGKSAPDLGLFTLNGSPTLNLYGGTYLNTSYGNTDVGNAYGANEKLCAGTIYTYQATPTVNMFAGAVLGPETADPSYELINAVVAGTFNMYGGTIRNGVASGDYASVTVSGTFNMYGGTITGGQGKTDSTDNLGNISNSGTFNMYGGTISGGAARQGTAEDRSYAGNLYTAEAGKTYLYGGTITGGQTDGVGGNISVDGGALTISGKALIEKGAASKGGNIYLSAGSVCEISGGSVTGGQATFGGNIVNSAGTLTVSDSGEITMGYATTDGGNIYCMDGATVNIHGGKVAYGTAEKRGGNISSNNAATYNVKINMTGGEISDGQANGTGSNDGGGNVFLYSGNSGSTTKDKATLNITGGTVKNGRGHIGGNIFLRNSAILLLGADGTVSGGKADTKADNIYVWNAAAAVISGTVTAAADAERYNIYVATSANLWLKDSATVNGLDTNVTAKSIYSANTTGWLVVDPGWSGSANVILNSWTAEEGAAVPSDYCLVGTLTVNYAKVNSRVQDTAGTYTGRLRLATTEQTVTGTLTGVDGTLVYSALGREFKPAENENFAYCDACEALVLWTPYADLPKGSTHAPGHYYLAGDTTYGYDGFQVVGSACFHTNGYTLRPDTTGTFGLYATGTLNIMGDGTVWGGSDAAIWLNGGKGSSKTNVYGGTYTSARSSAPVVWIYLNGGTLNFYDGIIDASGTSNAMFIDGSEGGTYSGAATFIMNGGQLIGGDSWVRSPVAGMVINGGTVDGYIGVGTQNGVSGTDQNIVAGTGYTKYNVGDKTVVANANVSAFGDGRIALSAGAPLTDISIDTEIVDATGITEMRVEILDAAGNVITTVTPESYEIPSTINCVNICAMVQGDTGLWQQTEGFTADQLPATARLYVNGMSVPVKTCVIRGADRSEQLSAAEWARYFRLGQLSYAVTGTLEEQAYCFGLFDSSADAEACATANHAQILLLQDNHMVLTGEVTVDLNGCSLTAELNGHDITVKGSGQFAASDAANNTYDAAACGKIYLADNADMKIDHTVDGIRYIAVKNADGSFSCHRLDVAVTHVTIRTSEVGLYYKSTFKADEVLLKAISRYGVVLSLNNMPGADWADDGTDINIATEVDAAVKPLVFGQAVTSGAVFGIMKRGRTAESNGRYGRMYIYANPYLVVDGEILMCDTENVGMAKQSEDDGFTGVAYSLYSALKKVDDNWDNPEAVQEADKSALQVFYDSWAPLGMNLWAEELPNISRYGQPTDQDP